MDFLESSLACPSVPSDPVSSVRLKKKRGPAAGDRPDPSLGRPLLDDWSSGEEAGRAVSLLDRVSRFASFCLWPDKESDQYLVPPPEQQPSLLKRVVGVVTRAVRACCETVVNGFIWSSQARPY